MTSFHFLFLLLLAAGCCYGNEERADHLLLLGKLPSGFSLGTPTFLDIRTNFSGTLRLVESSEFRAVVNISAPDLHSAYKVKADFESHNGGLLLQVRERELSLGIITLTWLGIGIAGATSLVMVIASLYAWSWYRNERSFYDLAEKKSVAGSSQRGVYRSRNSLQVVNLPPLGDLPIHPPDRDELDALHNDDSLKQVPEMPEEEEAEAIEMEELTLLKLKDMDSTDPTSNENDVHRLTPQERNLTKNQLHAQNKNIYKDLLKKDKPAKPPVKDKPKQLPRRRTPAGLYTGVASGPEMVPGSADDSVDSEPDLDMELGGDSVRSSSDPNYENTERKPASYLSPQRNTRQGSGPVSNIDSKGQSLKLDNLSHANHDREGLQVMADVHKVGTQPEMVKVSTPDKQTHPGIGSSLSPDMSRPTLTTFNSPAQTPPVTQGKSIRFKEPDQDSDQSSQHSGPPPTYNAVVTRFAPGFGTMGDIPEDPREDYDSAQSESGRSRSMYGSSEIFDANNPEHTYYNLEDSDIDIPPLDAEDFFSDGGLPSPRSASLGRGVRTQDDSSLSGPRSMFFGRDHPLMGVPKPRPNSSIIPRGDHSRPGSDSGVSSGPSSGVSSDQTSTPVNSELDSMSPKLPPPPLPQEELNQDQSAFSFPPPPRYFTLPQRGSYSSNPSTPPSSGEYVTLPNNSTKAGPANHNKRPPQTGRRGGGVGGRLALGSSYTHMMLLSTLCVLALATGVYCRLVVDDDDTRVDITIFAPTSFLSAQNNTIFFNLHKATNVEIEGGFPVLAYVLNNPILEENGRNMCQHHSCQQGCDIQTGECICNKGYRLVDQFHCIDVNECAEGFTNCHPSAGCLNRRGSYTCVCSIDYYGDGKTCHDCNTPCRPDQYEDQPCSKTKQKICKECTNTCPKGYYMASHCSPNTNAVCRVCQPPCAEGEYEYRTCSNYHDRQCRNVSLLPDLERSENIILEEDRKVVESEVTVEHLPNLAVGYTRYSLKRGTGLHVDISIQKLEAAQQFLPLDVKNVSISSYVPDDLRSTAVHRFCPHPVPDYFVLNYTKHEKVTYQLNEEGEIIPCQTFKTHGTFPEETTRKDNSFLCREPGSLTKLFEIPPDIFQTSTYWAERSKRCKSHSERCELCTRKCAQQMILGGSDCSVVGDNNDNGWSPRLQVCYNCCARSNCTNDCRSFHRLRCQPLKCHYGNLVEFSVFPSWRKKKNSKFFCHITPLKNQRLLEMKYVVRSDAHPDPVYAANITIDGGEEWETQGRSIHRDKLLTVLIDSHLDKLPDFLEGRSARVNSDFHVGSYVREGSRVETTVVSSQLNSILIHPLKPFGVSLSRDDPQKCENDILKESLIAVEHRPPYSPNHDLMAVAFHNNSPPFVITRVLKPPVVTITTDHRSFLKGIFPSAVLKGGSLTGRMKQNETHWTMEVMGSVVECPGYLKVILSDPAYRSTPLYSADIAVNCPRSFHLHFYLPSADALGLDRQVVASVADAHQVHHLRLHRPAKDSMVAETDRKAPPPVATMAPAPMKQEKRKPSMSLPQGFIFSIPYMVSVGGATFLMICLLVIGLIVQPGVPAPEPPILRCHHALFMVIYVVFQFIYSIIATSSVFFLVVIAVNSPRVGFVQQYQQQSAVLSASHQLELTAMQSYLHRELSRQDAHMDDMRSLCKQDMTSIVTDMKKLHKKIVRETEDIFKKHKLEVLLEEHRHRSMQQLAQDLLSFRDKYNQAVRTMLLELNHNVRQAHRSIENNTWLAGARFLHGVVKNTRQHINNEDTKPFLQWAHLQSDLSKLIVDVSFSLPSLPKLADIEEVIESEAQPSKRSKNIHSADKLHTTHIHNQWFSPFSSNATWDRLQYQQDQQRSERLREGQSSFRVYHIFALMLVCLDAVLVIHRMLKAKIGGQLLLYGYPEYMDFRERKDEGDDDVFDDDKKCGCWFDSPFCQAVKAFISQVMSSSFIPKAVVVVGLSCVLRGVLYLSSSMLTVESLHSAGLYHSSEDYLDLHSQLINGRLQAHAHHINTIDFPAHQTWMSTYIQRHQFAFQVYGQQLERMQHIHNHSYCHYLQSLGLAGNCSLHFAPATETDAGHGVISPACQFQPVLPKLYKRSESVYRNLSEHQLSVLLENVRAIIFDTCQIIVVFMSIIVLKELLCAVVWIFIRRSGLIRLRIIYETDQDEPAPTG